MRKQVFILGCSNLTVAVARPDDTFETLKDKVEVATIIGTLQSVAWMLLVFFLFALIAFVIVKGLESRKKPE